MEKLITIVFFCALPALCLLPETDVCYRLVTDFSQDSCTEKTKNSKDKSYYYSRGSNCLPKCEEYVSKPASRRCSSDLPCLPGYLCANKCIGTNITCTSDQDCKRPSRRCLPTCVADPGSCMSYWAKTDDYVDTYFTASVFKPSCTNEGKWKAIQCKGGVNGRCFCFDANGKRLFGEAVVHKLNQMTCACSRRKADLLSQGRSYVSLHCDSLGNYEKLQCDSGLCWCVEPKTGKVTAPVVPMKAMIKLPCYELSQTGSQYYRQCDSVEYALSVISATLRRHGVRYPNIGSIICDGDGAYGAYTVKDGMAHCTSRDGNNISPYASEDSLNFDKLNCNCARDKQRYSYKLSCQTNGNYEYLQSAQSSGYYCVDDDGFAKTEMFNAKVDCSKYY